MKFEVLEAEDQAAVIKVIGVGGCGGNAVDHMIQNGVEGVEFICANTDAQALKRNQARTLLQLGTNITKGLGAGANPDICLLYTSPSPRDGLLSRMPSSA